MVNITSAAKAAANMYAGLIALGGNYSYPLSDLSPQIASFFLPNYTAYSLGSIRVSPNQSVVEKAFEKVNKTASSSAATALTSSVPQSSVPASSVASSSRTSQKSRGRITPVLSDL